MNMNVKRERTELSTTLKGLKRLEIQSLCKASAGGSKMRRLADEQHPRRTTSKALPEQGAYWKSVWWNTSLPKKCDKAARGNCNTARPLLPQKKSHSETSVLQAKGTQAATAVVSKPTPTLQGLQASVDDLLARLMSPGVTEAQINDIVNARLAEQRAEIQGALTELQNLCQVGFLNVQSSFDAVETWKDEVTGTFSNIQSWAAKVEQRIVASKCSPALPRPSLGPARTMSLSSTPTSQLAPLLFQTPAIQPITAQSVRRVRLSDAAEYSLATIPEQAIMAADASLVEEAMQPAKELQDKPTSAETDEAGTILYANKRVRIESPEQKRSQDGHVRAGDGIPSRVPLSQSMEVAPAFRTPAASKTLFGTERSTEERFDDAVDRCELSGETLTPHGQ
ncbi:MAG: hypothetical protein CYPHOPRED_004875, partial [Cyphobasidiales sp. Tagirdzhanova-0007]